MEKKRGTSEKQAQNEHIFNKKLPNLSSAVN